MDEPVPRFTHEETAHPHAAYPLPKQVHERPWQAANLPRPAPPHQPGQRSTLLRLHSLICAVSCPPTSRDFRPSRPEPGLNSKCSLFTSCRGVLYPCFSYEFATCTVSSPNSISCTPPAHAGVPRSRRSLEGALFDISHKGLLAASDLGGSGFELRRGISPHPPSLSPSDTSCSVAQFCNPSLTFTRTRPFKKEFTPRGLHPPKFTCFPGCIGPQCPFLPQVPFPCTPRGQRFGAKKRAELCRRRGRPGDLGDRPRDPERPAPGPATRLTCHRAPEDRICLRQPQNHHVLLPHVHRFLRPVFRRRRRFPPGRAPRHPSSLTGFGLNAPFQRSVHFHIL
jgi:hypothetical protein